jgi:ABC-type polysaccharide/polyol phosphate export permease
MTATVRVLGRAAYLSLYEYFGLYNPRAYVITWVPRVVLETLFLALVAQFVGGRELLLFTIVGFAGYRTLHSTVTFTTTSVTGELFSGTIPLLVGSPTSPILVLSGRNLAWMFHGLSTGALTIAVAVALGLRLTPPSAIGALCVLVVIELSAYALGIFVGSILLRFPALGTLVGNIVGFTLFAIAGVTAPLAALPELVQVVALALPLAHGLLALREVLGPSDPVVYLPLIGQEMLIGGAYLVLATISFRIFLHQARLRGTLDYH